MAQGTVASFDVATRTGAVLLDDGLRLPFDAPVFNRSGLRTLRFGQRVQLELGGGDDHRVVTALTIVTLPVRD